MKGIESKSMMQSNKVRSAAIFATLLVALTILMLWLFYPRNHSSSFKGNAIDSEVNVWNIDEKDTSGSKKWDIDEILKKTENFGAAAFAAVATAALVIGAACLCCACCCCV